ncbi:PPC domain-containing protein [Romeria aff. gracilis LEGE 07310]|uniref:PPC domain-containing protein n=1 Tax=Vasconcelosia minhoensis LEGE 07310 TaxID=915328 RepID=A0A8J7ALX0_9CYAN|nr:PPC domain-containing protein [Romeria gracilis]MBE9080368.1 PPC domain-containing protein [Romeria aff. gracilis LEGE 07310]
MKFSKPVSLSLATLLVSLAAPFGLRQLSNGEVSFSSLKAIAAAPLLQIQDELNEEDELVEFDEGNRLVDLHRFDGTEGEAVSISLESQDFDTYLLLSGPDGEVIDSNDDISADNLNSKLELTLPQSGSYRVFVTSVEYEGQGSYELTVLPEG